jgi:hypothetical protein
MLIFRIYININHLQNSLMKTTRTVLVFPILFFIEASFAQTGFSDWETSYFSINATIEQKEFVNKVEFPRNIPFPKIKPYKFGFDNIFCWNIYLKKYFAAFFT